MCSIDNFPVTAACAGAGSVPRIAVPARSEAGHDLRLRRGREDDRPDARRHGVRPDDLAGDHARLPGPDQGLRPGPVRLQRLRDRRRRRDGAGRARPTRRARRARRSPVLGIPIAIKNLYDTYDMATTNGRLTFAGFRPKTGRLPGRQAARGGRGDHRQGGARGVRDVAATTPTTRGARSGTRSSRPSRRSPPPAARRPRSPRTSPAGALGSQTGDSLYAPASGASLVTLRGTDGLESGSGIMPLSWLTDFGGVMTRSVADLADMLNVVTGTDPAGPDDRAGRRRAARGLALDARPGRAARQADRLHPVRLGGPVRHHRHDRRRPRRR